MHKYVVVKVKLVIFYRYGSAILFFVVDTVIVVIVVVLTLFLPTILSSTFSEDHAFFDDSFVAGVSPNSSLPSLPSLVPILQS